MGLFKIINKIIKISYRLNLPLKIKIYLVYYIAILKLVYRNHKLPIYKCYGPYKQDSTSTKRGLVLDQNQCAERGTDGTSGAMGRGVAESHD